ncbi:hypothetical protein L3X38_000937 [Prunus dulcis]|uniref:Uncharacterized protein n=1 Tax=Prunus dulcis TaxID=3755 RepID=A0AAD4WR43_PRUDU|nr:hypothetical protein L3X38_000937 [Prunus dulcis]
MVHPMTSEDLWLKCHRPLLLPPLYHKKPRRPRKKRMRLVGEPPQTFNPKATKLQRSKEGWKLANVLKLAKLLKLANVLKLPKLLKLPMFLKLSKLLKLCMNLNQLQARHNLLALVQNKKKRFKSPAKRNKFTNKKNASQTVQGSQTSIGSQYVQGSQSVQACPSSQTMHGSQPTASSLQPFGTAELTL